jgi:succinate dehydrogenase/fumarate reductase cytochrome b subunit
VAGSRAAAAARRPESWDRHDVTSAAESAGSAAKQANQSAKQVAQSKPVKVGARIGILAYGITHLLIGWLALQVAFGQGGEQADQGGAFEQLAAQPFGRVLLWVLTVGFVMTALWRLELAIWGFGYESDRTTNLRKRAVCGFKVVVFIGLAILAGRTAAGSGGGGGGGQQGATAGLLGLPGGQFIVGAIGIGIVVAGGSKIYQGWQKKFRNDMDMPSDRHARMVAERTGQVGFIAKGLSVALIGILVIIAAIRFNPAEASGLDSALKSLVSQPFGPYLLMVVALGLICYGVFCFFDARYHRV